MIIMLIVFLLLLTIGAAIGAAVVDALPIDDEIVDRSAQAEKRRIERVRREATRKVNQTATDTTKKIVDEVIRRQRRGESS